MRRPLSLALLSLVVVFGIIASIHYLSPGARPAARVAAADSIAQLDSAAETEPPVDDTMCVASRIGLPCDPR